MKKTRQAFKCSVKKVFSFVLVFLLLVGTWTPVVATSLEDGLDLTD